MSQLTFLEAKTKFAHFVSSAGPTDPEVATAINFVVERFMKSGLWKGNKFTANFWPYDNQITTPPDVMAINALQAIELSGMKENCILQSDYYRFSEAGRGIFPDDFYSQAMAIRQGDGYCTFRDPKAATTICAYSGNTADSGKTIHINALDANGKQIWTDGVEGFDLVVSQQDDIVVSQVVTQIYKVIKPQTVGFIFLYSTADLAVIANYTPGETVPNYQRYNIVGHLPETRQYVALCTRAYIQLSGDNEIMPIENLNALRYGLQAYFYEITNDFTKANEMWTMAFKCLNDELELFNSDGTDIKIKVQRKCFIGGFKQLL